MKMQIVSCPGCGSSVLDGTFECHECGYVFKEDPSPQLKTRTLPSAEANDEMEICSKCGESCRTGLVRCWNCQAFLRPEIEESYRKMRSSGAYDIEHVELPIIEATEITEQDSLQRRIQTPDSYLSSRSLSPNEGDDFELSDDSRLADDDEDTFDLRGDFLNEQSDYGNGDTENISSLLSDDQSLLSETDESEPPIRALADETAPTGDLDEATIPLAKADSDAAAEQPAKAPEPPAEDELLKIAADEEQDIQRVRKSLRSKDTFVIFCPQGCRIRVKERHRGMSGKCPRCQAPFVVPRKSLVKASDAQVAAPPVPVSRYQKWMEEIRLHVVDPLKLRIKADSLLNECQSVDLGFSSDDLLIATLIAGKFGANVKKAPPVRQAMLDHFLKQGAVETLAVAAKKAYSKELLAQFVVAQPAPIGTESLFGDIPVFGVNRIAVRIPKLADEPHPRYLSFCLSEFRNFVDGLKSICGIDGLGANTEIPLTDVHTKKKCKYSEATILELAKLNYYEKDPGFKLEISGWKCAACGIFISEATRLDKKLGGVNGKAIAKAKCPSCSKKFGSLPIYQLAGANLPKSEGANPTAIETAEMPAPA